MAFPEQNPVRMGSPIGFDDDEKPAASPVETPAAPAPAAPETPEEAPDPRLTEVEALYSSLKPTPLITVQVPDPASAPATNPALESFLSDEDVPEAVREKYRPLLETPTAPPAPDTSLAMESYQLGLANKIRQEADASRRLFPDSVVDAALSMRAEMINESNGNFDPGLKFCLDSAVGATQRKNALRPAPEVYPQNFNGAPASGGPPPAPGLSQEEWDNAGSVGELVSAALKREAGGN